MFNHNHMHLFWHDDKVAVLFCSALFAHQPFPPKKSLIKEHKHSSQTLNTAHTHAHNAAGWMAWPEHNSTKLNHWCQSHQNPSPHTNDSLTHMQGLTNKDLFVYLHNLFSLRQHQLWLEGECGQFHLIMQINMATIVLKPPRYGYGINRSSF